MGIFFTGVAVGGAEGHALGGVATIGLAEHVVDLLLEFATHIAGHQRLNDKPHEIDKYNGSE